MLVRVPLVALALAFGSTCGLVAACAQTWTGSSSAARLTTPSPSVRAPSSAPIGALEVLHRWDRRRASAWARGDVAALTRLYVAGSSAGRADVALLRRYLRRGVTVPDLRMQVLRAAILVDRPRQLVVRVSERVAGREARLGGDMVLLPSDLAQVHVVELRRVGAAWRVVTVR